MTCSITKRMILKYAPSHVGYIEDCIGVLAESIVIRSAALGGRPDSAAPGPASPVEHASPQPAENPQVTSTRESELGSRDPQGAWGGLLIMAHFRRYLKLLNRRGSFDPEFGSL